MLTIGDGRERCAGSLGMTEQILRFGPFELRPSREQLLMNGQPVSLGSRAIAILTLLAQRAGAVISAREITDHVWPNLHVQENNLRVHLTAIRRVLRTATAGDIEIINVPGRGYRLQADVNCETVIRGEAAAASTIAPLPPPLPIHRLIGRTELVADLVEKLDRHRLITVVGPGGIGKTSAALAALSALPAGTAACFVDLSNCTTSEHIITAAAAALQSPMGKGATPAVLIEQLRCAKLILLLDNCEHLVETVARVAEAVLQSCPQVTVLATSREPLRVQGEVQLRLQTLPVPAMSDRAEMIADNPAAALFLERAQAAGGTYQLTESTAQAVGAICRALDGLPLALELAAAAAPMVGLDALASELAHRLSLLALGRRTLARHETLDAMLDWSFELLSPDERSVLRQLGCFRSGFDLAAAVRVAVLDSGGEPEVMRAVLQLAAKSLLVIEPAPQGVTYRLLETTKVYARRKLAESGKVSSTARRHAEWVRSLLMRAQEDWPRLERGMWWERYGPAIDDVRAALVWALGTGGDQRLGVRLTLGSAPLWIGMAQFAEYNRWLEKALATLEALGEADGPEEIQLQIGLCVLLFNADRPGEGFVRAASRVLRIGTAIGDPLARATGLWLLSGQRGIMGDYPGALDLARQMLEPQAPSADPVLRTFALRVMGLMTFRVGLLAEAEAIGTELMAGLSGQTAYGAVLRYDHSTVTRGNHALTMAITGRFDTARTLVAEAVLDGARLRNPASFCYLLSSLACPVALWLGLDDLARSYVQRLAREAGDNRFTYMAELATWFSRILDLRAGLSPPPPELQPPLPHDKIMFITTYAPWCDAEVAARAEATAPHWATAEILRAHGEAQRLAGQTAAAQVLFRRALALAEEQGSKLWALRAATSLAQDLPREDAVRLLEPVLAGIEGDVRYGDVRKARALLGA